MGNHEGHMPSQCSELAKGNDDKAQDSMDSFMETAEKLYSLPLDKAARKVEIFSGSIELLDKKLGNATYYKTKNNIIDKQTQNEKKILNANKTAKTESKKSLNSAGRELRKNKNLNSDDGISKKERNLVKKAIRNNKEVNLSYFKANSAGYKAAVKYNEALKASKKATNDAASAQQDYNAWLVEASKLKFDNIADHYDKKVKMIGYDMSAIDDRISEIEAAGRKAQKSYYEDQKKINNDTLSQYKAEKAALEESIKHIKKGTDEWYDAYDQIQQVSSSISECTKKTYELNDAISQLHFDMLDDIVDGTERIITEQEFLQGLFAHEKNTDKDTGTFTDAGLAKLGSLSAGYYASGENARRLAEEVAELQRMLDAGETYSSVLGIDLNSRDNVEKKLNEVRAKEQEWVKERYDNATAIHDMMEELYRTELDYLKELVDAKKEALDAEKDLHDYQRTISEKTESIATIQKQIAAYSGDTSEEGRAKLQRLQKDLDDKKDDLKETEYDRLISDQKEMLDDLYDEYNKKLEEEIEQFMVLVQKGLDTANDNMSGIRDFLEKVSEKNGYAMGTNGLFDGSNGIEKNVGNAASQVEKNEERKQESTNPEITLPTAEPFKNGFTEADSKTTPLGGPETTLHEKASASDAREKAKKYIGSHATKAKKKKKEYSDVSQRIYENKAKAYNGTGKVLSTESMKGLAKLLGIKYDNYSKNGNLYKTLKKIKFPGFRKGGVVSVDDIEKQVRSNGDDGLVSVKNGEGFLTKAQTDDFRKFIGIMEDYKPAMQLPSQLSGLPATPTMRNLNNVVNVQMGGITMNGVNDPKEFSKQLTNAIKNNQKVQKSIHSIETQRIGGDGILSVNKIKH